MSGVARNFDDRPEKNSEVAALHEEIRKLRKIIEAVLYLQRGGLPWRMLPPCFPPVSTVRYWFYLWRDSGRRSTTACCRPRAKSKAAKLHQAPE